MSYDEIAFDVDVDVDADINAGTGVAGILSNSASLFEEGGEKERARVRSREYSPFSLFLSMPFFWQLKIQFLMDQPTEWATISVTMKTQVVYLRIFVFYLSCYYPYFIFSSKRKLFSFIGMPSFRRYPSLMLFCRYYIYSNSRTTIPIEIKKHVVYTLWILSNA